MNHAQNKHNTWYFNKLWLENAMYLYTGRWVSMCASESIWCCDGGSIDDAPLKAAILRETDKLLCEWIMKSNANLLAKRRVTEKCLKLKMIINGWVAVTHTHTHTSATNTHIENEDDNTEEAIHQIDTSEMGERASTLKFPKGTKKIYRCTRLFIWKEKFKWSHT